MANPLPSLLALTSIADGSQQQAAPIRNNYSAIQTAVNELITALKGGTTGALLYATDANDVAYLPDVPSDKGVLVWSAALSRWVPSTKVLVDDSTGKVTLGASQLTGGAVKTTVSTIAGGPPLAPSDGDVWIATAVDANGTRWAFQYNAGSGSASKWEFIGGSPLEAEVATDESTASAVYTDLATVQSLTLPRGGDYLLRWGMNLYVSAGAGSILTSPAFGAGAASDTNATFSTLNATTIDTQQAQATLRTTGLGAATVIKIQYRVTAGATMHARHRWMSLTPVRIS